MCKINQTDRLRLLLKDKELVLMIITKFQVNTKLQREIN